MGALKLAETAAATAQPSKSRPVTPSARMARLTMVDRDAARCTTGPSRPDEPPVDKEIMLAKADTKPRRTSTRPSFRAAPSITSLTDRARPSSVNRFSNRPTIKPPRIGMIRIKYHGRLAAKLCKVDTSSVP